MVSSSPRSLSHFLHQSISELAKTLKWSRANKYCKQYQLLHYSFVYITSNRYIFNLVKKEHYCDKPTYYSLSFALCYLRSAIIEHKIRSTSKPSQIIEVTVTLGGAPAVSLVASVLYFQHCWWIRQYQQYLRRIFETLKKRIRQKNSQKNLPRTRLLNSSDSISNPRKTSFRKAKL